MNFLLSNQTDKAVDLFLDMLQKQEIENEIESHSQFEKAETHTWQLVCSQVKLIVHCAFIKL